MTTKTTCFCAAVLFAALLACKQGKEDPKPVAALDPEAVDKPCQLVNDHDPKLGIAVFPDHGDLALAVNSKWLKDDEGVRHGLSRSFTVSATTGCKVLSTERYMSNEWMGRKVLVTSGEYTGKTGWVQRSWARVN